MYKRKEYERHIVNFDSNLEFDIENKKVLYIPIYSMREYNTGFYNVAADGNVNRFLSKFSLVKNSEIHITVPTNVKNENFLKNHLDTLNIQYKLIPSDFYGENALSTRKNEKWFDFLNNLDLDNYDIILFEPNIIGRYNFKDTNKVIYWMPVSETINSSPSFLGNLKNIDRENLSKYKTYVGSKNQQELYTNTVLDNNLFNPSLFINYNDIEPYSLDSPNTVFIPFRQSDKGYKVEEIYRILEQSSTNWNILYTAPNNVDKSTSLNKKKVSTDRKTYYSILKSKPYIFYLEDPDEIFHIGILEFIYFGCPIYHFKNSFFSSKDKSFEIEKLEDLKKMV